MKALDIVQFLRCLGVPSQQIHVKDSGWVTAPCVLAPWTHEKGTDSHPSFAIKIVDGGESYFNCYACDHGDLLSIVEKLISFGAPYPKYQTMEALELVYGELTGGVALTIKDYAEPGVPMDIIFDESWLINNFILASEKPEAIQYLHSRGLSDSTIFDLEIRYDPTHNTVCFPIRNWHGDLVGLRGRYIHKWDGPRYHDYSDLDMQRIPDPEKNGRRNKLPWLGEHWVKVEEPVVMVESVFDAAAVWTIYPNVVAPLSVGISKQKAKRMSGATEIVTLFDGDKGGETGREKVSKYLRDALISHLYLPTGMDPGKMSQQDLVETLDGEVPLT